MHLSNISNLCNCSILCYCTACSFISMVPPHSLQATSITNRVLILRYLEIDVCMLFYSTAIVLPFALFTQLLLHLFHCLYWYALPVSLEVKNICKNFDRNFSNCMILKENDYLQNYSLTSSVYSFKNTFSFFPTSLFFLGNLRDIPECLTSK